MLVKLYLPLLKIFSCKCIFIRYFAIEIMHIKNFTGRIRRETIHKWRHFKELVSLNEKFFKQVRGNRIVVYHGICLKDHLKFTSTFLRRDTFEQHLQFYQKYFQVVSLNDFYRKNFDKDKFNVCITFDD